MTKSKRIIDNPSQSKLLEQCNAVESLKRLSKIFPELEDSFNQFDEIKKQLTIVHIPDQFNDIFSQHGWIIYESMSREAAQKSIAIYENDGLSIAEEFLADSYDQTIINQGILRFNGNDHFKKRIRLTELAKDDYLASRYHACIPLLLSLIDGLVNDISKHVGFFANNIDLTAWDCIAAHESGLQSLTLLLNKGRNKTNEDAISIPYRNGILHGRELNFDNKIVAAKCWATLFTIRDWAEALESNTQELNPKITTHWTILKKAKEEWKPRTSTEITYLPFEGDISNLPENTPEHTVALFINHWCNKRFGLMADLLSHNIYTSQGNKIAARDAKQEFNSNIPISFKILSIKDNHPYITLVNTEVLFAINGQKKSKNITVRTEYYNSEKQKTNRLLPGQWTVIQNSFSDIIYNHH